MGAEQSMPSSAHAYLGEHRATPVALYEKALAAGPRDSPTASNRTNSDSASYDDGEKGGSSASSPAGAEVDLPAVSEAAAMEEPKPDFEAEMAEMAEAAGNRLRIVDGYQEDAFPEAENSDRLSSLRGLRGNAGVEA